MHPAVYVFMQDNAAIYTVIITKDYIYAAGIDLLTLPAKSPILNPIRPSL